MQAKDHSTKPIFLTAQHVAMKVVEVDDSQLNPGSAGSYDVGLGIIQVGRHTTAITRPRVIAEAIISAELSNTIYAEDQKGIAKALAPAVAQLMREVEQQGGVHACMRIPKASNSTQLGSARDDRQDVVGRVGLPPFATVRD
jgi:hypothetical protein